MHLGVERRHRGPPLINKLLLQVIAWGPQSESTLHNLFSSFLSRCTPDCHAAKKAEVAALFILFHRFNKCIVDHQVLNTMSVIQFTLLV